MSNSKATASKANTEGKAAKKSIFDESQTSSKASQDNVQEQPTKTTKKDKKGPTAQASKKPAENNPPKTQDSDTNSDSESEPPFIPRFWNGNMPTANGIVAKTFQANMCNQLQGALNLLRFLTKPNAEFKLLDLDTTITPCLLAVPGSGQRSARVVYGLGTGAGATGIKDNDLHSNFLALTGELEDGVSIPNVMTLPPSIITTALYKLPTIENFEEQRLTTNNKVSSWFKKSDLKEEADLPQIMPTPAFLVFDAIDKDIDALIIYERWQSVKETLAETEGSLEFDNALTSFLIALLTPQENNIKVKQAVFMTPPSPIAQKWKKLRLQQLFHTQTNTTKTPTPSHTNFVEQVAQAVVEKQ